MTILLAHFLMFVGYGNYTCYEYSVFGIAN